ncbi:MAG: hypothetical protein IJN49_01060 [Clostridia bacterium]|nr:hypothetical protein [Clostridia bacterium]
MNEIIKKIIIETLDKHKTVLKLLIYGFGGVVFESQFKEIAGVRNNDLVNFLTEHKYIKVVKINKNNLIVARNKLYKNFGLENKSSVLSGKRVLHSSLYAEILIRCHASDERYIEKSLHAGTMSFYSPEDALNLITRVKAHAEKHGFNTEYLSGSIDDISAKVDFFKKKTKGSKTTLSKSPVAKSTKDILVLKDNSTYIMGVNFDKANYIFDVAVFSDALNFGKIIRQVFTADKVIRTTFFGLPVKISITVYSHFPENKGLVAKTQNYLKSKSYENEVNFKFFDTKRKLFSGIDINKWL